MIEPRSYQTSCINQLRDAFQIHRSVILEMKTGLGKTVVAGGIAAMLAANGHGALALVHKRELVRQFCKTLNDAGLQGQYGLIQSGVPESPWQKFHVGSIPTLYRRKLPWMNPKVVIVDECHHAKAKTWENTIRRFPNSKILGLSATPGRLDGKPLGDLFDYIVHGPSFEWSVENGYLAQTVLVYDREYANFDTKGVGTQAGDYNKKQLGKRVSKRIVADAVHAYLKHAKGQSAIFFGVNTSHSEEVAEKFRAAGVTAEHVDGTTPDKLRDEIMARFGSGDTLVLCNCDIVSEGTDVPRCSCVLDGQPTKSVQRFMQKAGRMMRPHEGLPGLYVDLVGNFWEHGCPDEERIYTLDGDNQGESVEVVSPPVRLRVCPECAKVYKASSRKPCPSCGAQPPPLDVPIAVERDLTVAPPGTGGSKKASLRREIQKIMRTKKGVAARSALEELRVAHGCSTQWKNNMIKFLGM